MKEKLDLGLNPIPEKTAIMKKLEEHRRGKTFDKDGTHNADAINQRGQNMVVKPDSGAKGLKGSILKSKSRWGMNKRRKKLKEVLSNQPFFARMQKSDSKSLNNVRPSEFLLLKD